MNYRLLSNFYNFPNSINADVWDIFEKEIFPNWTYDAVTKISFEQQLSGIRQRLYDLSQLTEINSATYRVNHIGAKQPEYSMLLLDIFSFNRHFASTFRTLEPDIEIILNTHFLPGEDIQIHIETQGSLSIRPKTKYELELPVLKLTLTVDGNIINRPQTFLNEARLTALALSIRLAMVGQKFRGIEGRDDLRILVLDDLLISLDMSNRMKVIKYLRENADFQDYQLIILTHDKGFYNILRNSLAADSGTWKRYELYEQARLFDQDDRFLNALCLEGKDSLVRAREFLVANDYDACALYLRKKTEELLRIYFDPTLLELTRFSVFERLALTLSNVEKEANQRLVEGFKKVLINEFVTVERLEKLKSLALNTEASADSNQRREVGQSNSYKNNVFNYLIEHYNTDKRQAEKLVECANQLNEIRGRILNLGAHYGDEALYRQELEEAYEAVKAFETEIRKPVVFPARPPDLVTGQ